MTDWKREHDAELGLRREWSARAKKAEAERAILIELVMDADLTPAAKNLMAIAIRDGGNPPTAETLAWAQNVQSRMISRERAIHEKADRLEEVRRRYD